MSADNLLASLSSACIARTSKPDEFPVHIVTCRICLGRWWNGKPETHRKNCPVETARKYLGVIEEGVPE